MAAVNIGPPPATGAAMTKKEHHNVTSTANLEIPDILYDVTTKKQYTKGKFLGKGGFARCYEVTETVSKKVYACKVVNKKLLVKDHQRDKMAQEITIHRALRHEFVVDFQCYFEDDLNVYILLELCGKKSLMEMQKRRRVITEPEARYFIRQMALACQYLHEECHIIHRDLKLGNIFITDSMDLKIGDFGLATHIDFVGERKRTLCGTPNYIAPEVLAKRGHSYEVDIWSIGCIMYTLLIGRPPFETTTLRDTYHKIRRGDYYIPTAKVGTSAKNLITKMLQVEPSARPTAKNILSHDWITGCFIPPTLPVSSLTVAPRFEKKSIPAILPTNCAKKPLTESNQRITPLRRMPLNVMEKALGESKDLNNDVTNSEILEMMVSLRKQLRDVVDKQPPAINNDDESEDPNLCPMMWICKWVDYSDKYGFGYQLSDDSIGVSFNDQSKIILLADGRNMHYVEKSGEENYYTIDSYPKELMKKVKLLNYFQQYMKENLLKATGGKATPDPTCIARLPSLWTWFRTSRAVVMVLSNGTLQINNFRDHHKMILCPLLGAISTLGSNKAIRTFKINALEAGISADMLGKIKYALEKVEVIVNREMRSNHP